MKAIILAAGCGERLGTLTRQLPKAVIPFLGRPLFYRILDLCDEAAFDEVIVVGGYGFHHLEAVLKDRDRKYRLLHNRRFRKGSLLTLQTALPYIDDRFLIANVDHIYPRRLFRKFLEKKEEMVAACDFDRPLGNDDMKVRIDKTGHLLAISKKLVTCDGGYIGMSTCSHEFLRTYKRAAQATLSKKGEMANVEQVLGTLIEWGEAPSLFDASGLGPWWEVDTPEEHRRAEHEIQKVSTEDSFLTDNTLPVSAAHNFYG